MNRPTLIAAIDVAAFIAFLFLTSSGILLAYQLPSGSGRWVEVWGLSRHQWGSLHLWLALGFFLLLALHLFQHWRYILNLLRGRLREGFALRPLLAVTGVVATILLAMAPLLTAPVVDDERGERPYRGGGQALHQPEDQGGERIFNRD